MFPAQPKYHTISLRLVKIWILVPLYYVFQGKNVLIQVNSAGKIKDFGKNIYPCGCYENYQHTLPKRERSKNLSLWCSASWRLIPLK